MKTYETLFIVHPDGDENEINKTIETIQNLITTGGGKILKVEKWGKRQLAYMIQKKREGVYVLMYFEAPTSLITELNRRYKLMTDTILRSLILQLNAAQIADIFDEKSSEKKAVRAKLNVAFDDDDDDLPPLNADEELVASTEE